MRIVAWKNLPQRYYDASNFVDKCIVQAITAAVIAIEFIQALRRAR
jgi:hypothetical protein